MSTFNGLTRAEAEKRLQENGRNCLKEEKSKTVLQMFLEQILNFTIMILAFGVGILGQLAVTEVPFLRTIFGTVQMTGSMWGFILILSLMPIIAHEIVILVKKIKKA